MWYFPLLKPYHDHVPVKDDLSDLEDQIRWCRANDEKCKEIGENARKFYDKYVAKDALLDYVQMVCRSIAKRYAQPPAWWEAAPPAQPPPKLRKLMCPATRTANQDRVDCVFVVKKIKTKRFEEMLKWKPTKRLRGYLKAATIANLRKRMRAKAKAK
jgi:hypothetical protein